MKKAETDDAVVVRVYDIEGRDGETAIRLPVPVKEAVRTNIIEEPARRSSRSRAASSFRSDTTP